MLNSIFTTEQYSYKNYRFTEQHRVDRFTAHWELEFSGICSKYRHLRVDKMLLIYLDRVKRKYKGGSIPIIWFVKGEVYSKPEFMPGTNYDFSFLDYFSRPVSVTTGKSIQWEDIPVSDLSSGANSGFIQDATGWQPKPLQKSVSIAKLEKLLLG